MSLDDDKMEFTEQESELMDEVELLEDRSQESQHTSIPLEFESRNIQGKFKHADKRVKVETLRSIAKAFVDINKRWTDEIDKDEVKPTRHVFGKDFTDTEHAMFYFMGIMNQFLPIEINIKSVNGILHFYHTSFPRKKVPVKLWQVYKPKAPDENGDMEFELELKEGRASGRKSNRRDGKKRRSNRNQQLLKRVRH